MRDRIEPQIKFASKDKSRKLMFSHNLTLSEFVCPIPICQPEADLGSILYIFHQTGCDCIAILKQDGNWGIISSSKLLALLTNPRQKLLNVTSSHPKKTSGSRNFAFEVSKAELMCSLEPAIVYQADTKLSKFWESLADNCLELNRNKHLIINSEGKLAGKLNIDKLLRYIGSRVARDSSLSLPTSSVPWLTLLDDLSLPLKIETAERKSCYENHCWQKLISHNRNSHETLAHELDDSIANWWMRKQLTALEKLDRGQSANTRQMDKSGDFSLEDSRNDCDRVDARVPLTNTKKQHSTMPSLNNLYSDRVDNAALNIQIEEGKDWNYIKIPLALEERLSETPATSHWLILAIKPSLWQLNAGASDRISDNSDKPYKQKRNELECSQQQKLSGKAENGDFIVGKSTVNELLATVSHELKSPLTGILGLSNLLKTQKIGKFNQRQAEYIRLIYNSGHKLMTIVNDLIELSSLTTGKFKLQPEKIELESLFYELYQQVIIKFQAMNSGESDLSISTSSIKLDIEPGLEIAIADRLRLSSILSHLMLEAVRFSGTSSMSSMAIKVEVKSDTSLGRQNISSKQSPQEKEYSQCSVSPEKQGRDRDRKYIAIAIKNRIENREICFLEDLDGDTQNVGLNLIIAKYLARTLQGNIKSSYNSSNCAFTLLLPTIDPSTKTSFLETTATNNGDSGRNLTVLCLYPEIEAIDPGTEDNHDLNFNLKQWAEQDWSDDKQSKFTHQHRIIEANGLEQAHILARIWQLDAIVLDGYQIIDPEQYLRSLQKSAYLSALPIIILDAKTAQAANRVKGLNVYPCLLPARCRSVRDLIQVIQIATEK